MAAPWWRAAFFGIGRCRAFSTSAALSRRTPPLGPMPNEDIDVTNLERLEKYRSFERYRRRAEQEARAPHWWRTYREHFVKETDPKDKIDIGLPPPRVSRTQQQLERKHFIKELRANAEEERAARLRTASIPLEAVRAEWERTCGPYHKQRLAEYYGLYRDLFHGATFVPRVPLHVAYAMGEEDLVPVYHGNEVTPAEASQAPEVTYEADKDSLWTLLLINLEPTSQPTGWLKDRRRAPTSPPSLPEAPASTASPSCSSSRTSRLTSLRTPVPHPGNVYPYLYPKPHASSLGSWLLFWPPFGVGLAFGSSCARGVDSRGFPGLPVVLPPTPACCPSCHSYQLAQRTFRTFDFYKKHQEAMTPAGLAFFQCRWDDSVTHTFHQLLDMREPVFEFVRPPPYHPKQKRFPHQQPLRYLDRYRDSHEPTYGIY